jgi:prolyl oligopeptidase
MATGWSYPILRKDESVHEERVGVTVRDPYRWLEDPDSQETKDFVKAQNAISLPYLESCPVKEKFHNRMSELYNYPKYSCPFKRGSRYFYFYNTGLQNQNVLYVQESLNGSPEVFIDPNTWSKDGTVALGSCVFSEDGELCAYGVSESGSDWRTIKVKRVADKSDTSDILKWVKFSSIAWTHDHKGFFYQRFPEPSTNSAGTETSQVLNQKMYYHIIGEEQSQDVLCYESPEHPDWLVSCELSDEGRYLIMYIYRGAESKNKLYYCDLQSLNYQYKGLLNMVRLIDDDFDSSYDFIANNDNIFILKTDRNSPKYKLVNVDIYKPDKGNWVTLIPEDLQDVLEWAAAVNNDNLVVCHLRDVKSVLSLYDIYGKHITQFPLDNGSITGYSGKRHQTEIFYRFVSFLTPGIIYRCDLKVFPLKPTVFRQIEVSGFDSNLFETKQVFYPSKDGTKVPMFIIHRKNIQLDGSHPLLLYGYGGFNISITPSFSVSRVIFVSHLNGIVAVANIRGGGEYGEEWHQEGMFAKRQNAYNDFQAAAEYLVDNKYTNTERLTIQGGSNGGLLVCCCANQRPDLYKCVISQVGVLDMLRFHKFTIGHAWTTDYGNPDNDEDFQWLYKISPLHNISIPPGDVQYPAILLLTADHDDRVVPLHSFKYIAQLHETLRGVDKQSNPLMIRIEENAGHGAGKPTTKIVK